MSVKSTAGFIIKIIAFVLYVFFGIVYLMAVISYFFRFIPFIIGIFIIPLLAGIFPFVMLLKYGIWQWFAYLIIVNICCSLILSIGSKLGDD